MTKLSGYTRSPWRREPVSPTYLSYLRQAPAPLAGVNLQYGLTSHRAELVKTLEGENRRVELCAVTGPDYGRTFDHELVATVQ